MYHASHSSRSNNSHSSAVESTGQQQYNQSIDIPVHMWWLVMADDCTTRSIYHVICRCLLYCANRSTASCCARGYEVNNKASFFAAASRNAAFSRSTDPHSLDMVAVTCVRAVECSNGGSEDSRVSSSTASA